MSIFIVILHYGSVKTTQSCVQSILTKEKGYTKILIINNSKDVVTAEDFGTSKDIIVIHNKKNLGFSGGVNVGIKYALKQNADAILLLNNDTTIKKPLLAVLTKDLQENPKVGVISPLLEFRKNKQTLYDYGGYINMLTGKTHHKNEEKLHSYNMQFPHYVSGCCVLIRKEVFEKVGSFDERFFLYYEDVDYCLRVKKKGFLIALDPRVVLFHGLSKSAGKTSRFIFYHQTKSALLFGGKYFKWSLNRICNILFVFFQSTLFFMRYPRSGFGAFIAIINYFTGNE